MQSLLCAAILRMATGMVGLALVAGCQENGRTNAPAESAIESPLRDKVELNKTDDTFHQQRANMLNQQLMGRDIVDQRVLDAMGRVPRHLFVPRESRDSAYSDSPLSIGHGQTISQPYIVALMTQLAEPQPDAKALDVGTGSGYQAAILAELVKDVYSIEIIEPLAEQARQRLSALGYENVDVRCGDGYQGWPEQAPFDVIIVAAAPDHVPPALVKQLAPEGKLVIPVGDRYQTLVVIEKARDGSISRRTVTAVAFVPMTGEAQQKREQDRNSEEP